MAARVGVAVAALSRRLGRGGGSVIGGRAILAIDPGAVAHLAGGRAVALVSGTNGKTTTTSLLGAAMASAGPLTTNLLGANQPPGIAAALAAGAPEGTAVLEVDEAWMERVVAATDPEVVLLLNLSRDQLDRNNEVRQLAARWRRTFDGREQTLVVANADDPLVVWSAMAADRVCWVGAGQPWTEDAAGCPNCGARVIFAPGRPPADELPPVESPDLRAARASELPTGGSTGSGPPDEDHRAAAGASPPGRHRPTPAGGWRCSGCDLRRPDLDVWLEDDVVVSADGWRQRLRLALPGRANRANAAMAVAAAGHLGVDLATALDAMGGATEIVGRYSTVEVGGVRARLLLAKNPAGWLEVLDVLRPGNEPVVVAINARIADGRDPSWLWDVPFERLAGRLVIASGERGRDLAVRLHYAEVEHRLVLDPVEAVLAAGEAARKLRAGQPNSPESGAPVEIDAVGNYTSFQELRTRLGR